VRLDRKAEAEKILGRLNDDPPPMPIYYWKYFALLADGQNAARELDRQFASETVEGRKNLFHEIERDFCWQYVAVATNPEWLDVLEKWKEKQ
jgi:hypothetical protein